MGFLAALPFIGYALLAGAFVAVIVHRWHHQPMRAEIRDMPKGHWWHEHLLGLSRLGLIILAVL